MAIIIEAPYEVFSIENTLNVRLFLAGGISGVSDWQSYAISELRDLPHLTIYNPRRKNIVVLLPQEIQSEKLHLSFGYRYFVNGSNAWMRFGYEHADYI